MMKIIKNNILWFAYFGFALFAMLSHEGEPLFYSDSAYGFGKPLVWGILFVFIVYSLVCHRRENFFRTMKETLPFYWTRQIGLDLYIGLLVPLALIYFNEGSVVVLAIWFLPIVIMANLATFLYIAMNYQSLVAHFMN